MEFLFSFIFFIFIITSILSSIGRQKRNNRQQSTPPPLYRAGQPPQAGSQPVQPQPYYSSQSQSQPYRPAPAAQPARPAAQPIRQMTQPTRPVQAAAAKPATGTRAAGTYQTAGAVPVQPMAAAPDESTTEYLARKAQEDQVEHQKEKMKDYARMKQEGGGKSFATRYLEGDPIPDYMNVCKCGYCGAENLLPKNARAEYKCYFCREDIV